MQTKSKRVLALLLIGTTAMPLVSFGDNLSNLQNQKNAVESKAKEKQADVSSLNSKKNSIYNELAKLDSKIAAEEKELKQLDSTIVQLTSSINNTQVEIEALSKSIQENQELFKKRLSAMYKNSKVGYIEVLLSSNGVDDFISRAATMQFVASYDKEILEKLKTDKQSLDTKKAELDGKKASTEIAKKNQVAKVQQLQTNANAKHELMAQITDDLVATQSEIDALQREVNQIDGNINKEKKAIAEAKLRAAREAKARQDANRKAAEKERAAAARQSSNNGATVKPASYTTPSSSDYGTGQLGWPVPSSHRITSYYGYRKAPIGGFLDFHLGIDIAAPLGTPVVAADSGVVIHAGVMGSYGNLIKIQHSNGLSTYYAHLNGYNVSVGQRVSKGQLIAPMGSTGNSTGSHLHFEVRKNGETQNPLNYVN